MKLDKIIYDVATNKTVPINLDKIVRGRALFQANSGGGKSYLLRKFLEESHGKIQQIIIDPEGEFHTLREKYEYLLVGKDNADIQIDVRHAPLMAKKLMETRASAILDLYELPLFERIRFVKIFVDSLVNLPKKLWHPCIIVIDEIHIFAPESSKGRSEALEAVTSLASRGRKRGYALIGATQKLSKFNKDVAAELNTKFTGRCTLDIDQKRAAQDLGIKNHTQLRNLNYEFYAYGPAVEGEFKVKSYPVKTTHVDIGGSTKYTIANQSKIDSMMKNFKELPQEAENVLRTTEDLKRKITEQGQEIKTLKNRRTNIDPNLLTSKYNEGVNRGTFDTEKYYKSIISQYEKIVGSLAGVGNKINSHTSQIDTIVNAFPGAIGDLPKKPTLQKPNIVPHTSIPQTSRPAPDKLQTFTPQPNLPTPEGTESSDNQTLSRCASRCLVAFAQRGQPSSKQQIGVLAEYSHKSGGFSNAISRLRAMGLIINNGSLLEITQEGIDKVGDYEPISEDPGDILDAWGKKLNRCPRMVLEYVCSLYPEASSKESIGTAINYSHTSGGFSNAISQLNSLGLITKDGSAIKASKEMFP